MFGTAAAAEADVIIEALNQGTDTLSFGSLTTAFTLNLGSSAVQSIHANRTLMLNSGGVFENAIGGSANDVLLGNALDNQLTDGNGNNILVGNAGADTLVSGTGRDILIGGPGLDTLTGGTGTDWYFLRALDDVITDLFAGETLDVSSGERLGVSPPCLSSLSVSFLVPPRRIAGHG